MIVATRLRTALATQYPDTAIDDLLPPINSVSSYPSLSAERLQAVFERIDNNEFITFDTLFQNRDDFISDYKKLLPKLADASKVQGASGAQTRSVHEGRENTSTGATQQIAAAVELGKKSND
jgi:hypothetical protein